MGVAVATGITFALVLFLLTRSKNKRKEPFEDQNSGMDELQADSKSDLGLRGTSQEHMDDTGTAYSESESKLYSSRPNLEDS